MPYLNIFYSKIIWKLQIKVYSKEMEGDLENFIVTCNAVFRPGEKPRPKFGFHCLFDATLCYSP